MNMYDKMMLSHGRMPDSEGSLITPVVQDRYVNTSHDKQYKGMHQKCYHGYYSTAYHTSNQLGIE